MKMTKRKRERERVDSLCLCLSRISHRIEKSEVCDVQSECSERVRSPIRSDPICSNPIHFTSLHFNSIHFQPLLGWGLIHFPSSPFTPVTTDRPTDPSTTAAATSPKCRRRRREVKSWSSTSHGIVDSVSFEIVLWLYFVLWWSLSVFSIIMSMSTVLFINKSKQLVQQRMNQSTSNTTISTLSTSTTSTNINKKKIPRITWMIIGRTITRRRIGRTISKEQYRKTHYSIRWRRGRRWRRERERERESTLCASTYREYRIEMSEVCEVRVKSLSIDHNACWKGSISLRSDPLHFTSLHFTSMSTSSDGDSLSFISLHHIAEPSRESSGSLPLVERIIGCVLFRRTRGWWSSEVDPKVVVYSGVGSAMREQLSREILLFHSTTWGTVVVTPYLSILLLTVDSVYRIIIIMNQ